LRHKQVLAKEFDLDPVHPLWSPPSVLHVSEEIQIDSDPTSFEEAMRSAHSSKWLEAMKDEMRTMCTNKV
jgi:hypothetical protein